MGEVLWKHFAVPWLSQSQFHFWPLVWVATHSCVEGAPPDTFAVVSSTEVLAIEVRVVTAIVPPRTLLWHSTITTPPVIVSVISGELHTIMGVTSCQAIPCCPRIASNTQFVVGTCTVHRKIPVMCIFLATFIVSQVYLQLCHRFSPRETANLLQAQPMLSLHVSKPVLIFCPSSVEILWPVTSSLEHGPGPSIVHVTPDREGLPTPWVYGVHSWPSAAQDIGLLAVKGEGVQVGITDWRGNRVKANCISACFSMYISVFG